MDNQLEFCFRNDKRDDFSRVHDLLRRRLEYLKARGRINLPDTIGSFLDLRGSENFLDQFMYSSFNPIASGLDMDVINASNDKRLKFLYARYQHLLPKYSYVPMDWEEPNRVLPDNRDYPICACTVA